ncbi:MAG: ribosome maturation factor RimM [Alphaproteobacteria bacterium]
MATSDRQFICVGAVAGAHGVRGLVRVKSFTAIPEDIGNYGDLSDVSNRRQFRIRILGTAPGKRNPDVLLAEIDGITDRTQAEALRGLRLYVPRTHLPELEDETYYHADLIGLTAVTVTGATFGCVRSVHDYGAGDLLEIEQPDHSTIFIPFSRAAVPEVDLSGQRLVIDLQALNFATIEPRDETKD